MTVSLLILLAIGIGPHLFSYRPATVLSGSMRPTFDPGDMLILRPEPIGQLEVGDVISYHIPVGDGHVETHRVIKILRRLPAPVVITKGDANNGPDPWRAELNGPTVWR